MSGAGKCGNSVHINLFCLEHLREYVIVSSLIQEIERKKGKAVSAEPKLSKKQHEAMQAELEKEAAIRNRLRQVGTTM